MKKLFSQFGRKPASLGLATKYIQLKSAAYCLVSGAISGVPEHWTASPLFPFPKCLISQCFSQRAKMLMTGFLPCSNLVEKAKLLKIKEL